MWILAYETIGNHATNPFPISFTFPQSPVILTAVGIEQKNFFKKLGRLTFLKSVPSVGITRGTSFVILEGSQSLKTSQLIDSSYQAEFYLYGYVPQIRIQIWQNNDVVNEDKELEDFIIQTESALSRIEYKIDNIS